MSIVVLILLLALNLLALYFGWHGRRLDARIAECELECRRLEAQNFALKKELGAAGARGGKTPRGLPPKPG